MEITNIRQRLFNPSKYEKTVSRSTNPFASIKGNVLSADVFESLSNEAKQQNKLTYSAFVGSMGSFGSRIKEKWNAMVSFGAAMKDQFVSSVGNFVDTQFPTYKRAISGIGDFLNQPIGGVSYETMPIAQLRQEFTGVVGAMESGNF